MFKTMSKKLLAGLSLLVMSACLFFERNVSVLASDVSFLKKDASNGVFSGVTKTAEEIGASTRSLVMTVAIIILFIGVIVVGVQLVGKNANKREEAKGRFVWIMQRKVIDM